MRLSILGLIALAACNNGGNCDSCNTTVGTNQDSGDTTCDSCGDDDTAPAADGYLNVRAVVNGSNEPTNIIIDGKVVGSSGTDIPLPPGTYTFYVGDDPAVTSGDGIPLDTASSQNGTVWENSSWIHPSITVTIASGETVLMNDTVNATPETTDDAVELNVYTSGMWTCDTGHTVDGADVSYTDGYLMVLQTLGQLAVTVTDLESPDYPDIIYGEFVSPTIATVAIVDGGTSNFYCWNGDEDADPREPTE